MRFKNGACYLIEDGTPDVAYRLFTQLLPEYGSGFCISRRHPERLRPKFAGSDVRLGWLAEAPGDNHFSANAMALLAKTIQQYIQEHASSGLILLDGLEYVIIHNGFLPTLLAFVEHLNEFIMSTQAIVLIAFRPETLDPRELALLERNLRVLSGKDVKSQLDIENLTTVLGRSVATAQHPISDIWKPKALSPLPGMGEPRMGSMRCLKCGTENNADVSFCVYCGAALPSGPSEAPIEAAAHSTDIPAAALKPIPPTVRERHPDFVGLIGLAFFLLIIGVVFTLNSNLLNDFRLWWDRIQGNRLFTRPPDGILASGILFFALLGLSNFLTSGLRWLLDRNRFGALARVLAGGGFLVLALLFFEYEARFVSGQLVLSIWTAVLGTLLIIYIALGLYWVRARRPAPAGAQAPIMRE